MGKIDGLPTEVLLNLYNQKKKKKKMDRQGANVRHRNKEL